jgi:tRNA (guanine-N7-)-methyltransferase
MSNATGAQAGTEAGQEVDQVECETVANSVGNGLANGVSDVDRGASEPFDPGRFTSRPIRSFVLRQGRFSPAQQRAFEQAMPRFGVRYVPENVHLEGIFGRSAATVLEIGFGMGETTAKIAEALPHINFLGCEVHTPGVGALLKEIEARGLTNLRICQHDAVVVLQHMVAPASLAGIHLYFPDPWPKARHHKRRIVQPEFTALVTSRLQPGGYFHAATDWQPYAEHMVEVLEASPGLQNSALPGAAPYPYSPRPSYRPLTKFENRGLKLGHGTYDLIYRKTP